MLPFNQEVVCLHLIHPTIEQEVYLIINMVSQVHSIESWTWNVSTNISNLLDDYLFSIEYLTYISFLLTCYRMVFVKSGAERKGSDWVVDEPQLELPRFKLDDLSWTSYFHLLFSSCQLAICMKLATHFPSICFTPELNNTLSCTMALCYMMIFSDKWNTLCSSELKLECHKFLSFELKLSVKSGD